MMVKRIFPDDNRSDVGWVELCEENGKETQFIELSGMTQLSLRSHWRAVYRGYHIQAWKMTKDSITSFLFDIQKSN